MDSSSLPDCLPKGFSVILVDPARIYYTEETLWNGPLANILSLGFSTTSVVLLTIYCDENGNFQRAGGKNIRKRYQ